MVRIFQERKNPNLTSHLKDMRLKNLQLPSSEDIPSLARISCWVVLWNLTGDLTWVPRLLSSLTCTGGHQLPAAGSAARGGCEAEQRCDEMKLLDGAVGIPAGTCYYRIVNAAFGP